MSSFVQTSIILFVASAFRTAFGFGEALIAVPLLSLLLPVKLAAPIAVLASVSIALFSVIKDWKHVQFSEARRLLVSTAVGIPFGLIVLRYAPEGIVKGILGIFLLAFSLFSIRKPDSFVLKDDRLLWAFGFLAGVTGGSYGMNGPPIAIYGAGRRWSPRRFRATIQAYFLPASALGMIGYSIAGLWTREVNVLFLESLPAIAVGIGAGRVLSARTEGREFTRFLYGGLALVAGVLLYLSFFSNASGFSKQAWNSFSMSAPWSPSTIRWSAVNANVIRFPTATAPFRTTGFSRIAPTEAIITFRDGG